MKHSQAMSIWGWRNHTIEIEWNSIWSEQLSLIPSCYYLTIAAIPKHGWWGRKYWVVEIDSWLKHRTWATRKRLCSSWCGVGLRDGNPDFGPSTFCGKVILKGKLEQSERLRMLVGRACLSKTGPYNADANCPQQ